MDALEQLRIDLTDETFINNLLKKVNLGFNTHLEIGYCLNPEYIEYTVNINKDGYGKSYIKEYYLRISLDTSITLSDIDKNKIHLTGTENAYTCGLLRALYKITVMLKTIYNFIINPYMEMEIHWKDSNTNKSVSKQDCNKLFYELNTLINIYQIESWLALYDNSTKFEILFRHGASIPVTNIGHFTKEY